MVYSISFTVEVVINNFNFTLKNLSIIVEMKNKKIIFKQEIKFKIFRQGSNLAIN